MPGAAIDGSAAHGKVDRVSALSELLSSRTTLDDAQIDHLQRLVGEWQLLSDLSFADLLLWVPVELHDGEAGTTDGFLCAAQCRPTTGPTAYQHDQVGVITRGERAVPMRTAFSEARIFRETEPDWDGDLPIRREAIPIRLDGADREVFAVLGKDANLASVRTPSQLELVYLQTAADLSAMVADGTFPNPDASEEEGSGPRVGDGVLRLEPDGTIIYASPNSLSAFSRLGVSGTVVGEPLHELTSGVADDPFDASDLGDAVEAAIDGGQPATIEVDGGGATVLFRAIPLRPRGETLGALLLMQDVTELRRRDRADHEQGRDDPRDPPPGEEQPADRGRAAAAAGAAGGGARGAGRARGVDAAGRVDRARPRDAVGVGRRGGRLRPGRRPAARDARRRDGIEPGGSTLRRVGTFGELPGRGRDRAGARAHRAGPERARARLPGRRDRLGAGQRAARPRRARAARRRRRRRPAAGVRRDVRASSGCRSCARWSPAELDGTVALEPRDSSPGTAASVLMPLARRARVGG